LDAFQHAAAGFVLRPVQVKDLLIAVNNVKKRIADKRENQHNGQLPRKIDSTSMVRQEIIGIPTMEGFEFLPVQEIIRCEALQKCTRVFTEARKEVFSSYNLGEFRKQLTAWGFFSPHKSHLINLRHVRKYHREGSIIMVDGSYVPVAKRKKGEFLNQVNHL
ncbi:MAG: LytTR family transcriptional regulator, partial [Lewinella sp.]|nr:LytTR family transcriptional regulator [Lewinella sp.]